MVWEKTGAVQGVDVGQAGNCNMSRDRLPGKEGRKSDVGDRNWRTFLAGCIPRSFGFRLATANPECRATHP